MIYTKIKISDTAEIRAEFNLDNTFVDCPDCGHETPLFKCGEEEINFMLWNDHPHYYCDECSKKRKAICDACGRMTKDGCILYDPSSKFNCRMREYDNIRANKNGGGCDGK